MAAGMGFVNHALGVGMMTMGEMANPNISMGEALVRGAFYAAGEAILPGFGLITTVSAIAKPITDSYLEYKRYGKGQIQHAYRPGFGGNYKDTQQAYTMRQRGVQAMKASKMNARSVLGSEARTFHTNF